MTLPPNFIGQEPPCARSYLFVSALRPQHIAKAHTAGADAIIVDLEDAVAPDAKDAARQALRESLDPAQSVIVRINPASTAWYQEDIELCRLAGVAAVMLPKVEAPDDIRDLCAHLDRPLPVLALIETARGLWNAAAIAQASNVRRLVFGPLDFAVDLGLGDDAESLTYYCAQLVLASRVACLSPPVDGPTIVIDDSEGLRADAVRSRAMGFSGKLCIHPRQVAIVNECFSPSAAEIEWATRVIAAAQAAGGAVTTLDGRMIDRPVLLRAASILRYRSVAEGA
jgi:citrate lyase subunit beta / citryl-CoA lyase